MSNPSDGSGRVDLAARYGRPSRLRRRLGLAAVCLVAAALLAWVVWSAWELSRPAVSGTVHSYDVVSPHRVDVTLDVSQPRSGSASCTVDALASDHSTVGTTVVRLPRPAGQHTVTATVRTDRRATTATVVECH